MAFSTLHDVLAGPHDPDSDALILTGSNSHLSRSALYTCVVEVALALQKAGIRPGDVVSMAYANTVSLRSICEKCAHLLPAKSLASLATSIFPTPPSLAHA